MDYKLLAKQFGLEIGRVVLVAIIPVILAYFEKISPGTALIAITVLKGVDKAQHKTGSKIKLPF